MRFSPNVRAKSCHDVYAKYVNDLFALYASSFYTRGGILPIMAYTRSSVRKGFFFRLQVYERVGILLVEVYERVGKSVIWVCETVQRANR